MTTLDTLITRLWATKNPSRRVAALGGVSQEGLNEQRQHLRE